MFTSFDTAILYVTDIKRAKDFYVHSLGLIVEYDDTLFISLKVSKDEKAKIALNAENREGQYPGHQTIILRTENIDTVYTNLKAKVKIIFALTTQPWGKTFTFTDPDGNKIEVVE